MSVYSLSSPARKAHAPYHIATRGLSGCANYSTSSPKWHYFQKKKVIEHKMCV